MRQAQRLLGKRAGLSASVLSPQIQGGKGREENLLLPHCPDPREEFLFKVIITVSGEGLSVQGAFEEQGLNYFINETFIGSTTH